MSRCGRFQIIGHRGVPCDAPENSLAGFARAMALGLTHIECDLHLTKDGHLVLVHDSTVNRTTNGQGRVSELTLAQIKTLDCGSWFDRSFEGEQVPVLEELLEIVNDEVHLILEIKEVDHHREAVDQVVELLRDRGLLQRASVTSFHWDPLERVRESEPRISTQALVRFLDEPPPATRNGPLPIAYDCLDALLQDPRLAAADVICPRAGDVTRKMVEVLHGLGFPVRVWGARTDCRAQVLHVLTAGVDGMTVDHPQYVMSICDEFFACC